MTKFPSTLPWQVLFLGLCAGLLLGGCQNILKKPPVEMQLPAKNEGTPVPKRMPQREDLPDMDDKEYLEEMILHHSISVDSSRLVMGQTKNQELAVLLNQVRKTQAEELGLLKYWYEDLYKQPYQPKEKIDAFMDEISSLSGDKLEKKHLQKMIELHQRAIDLSYTILETTQNRDIQAFANDELDRLSRELPYMQELSIKL